MSTPEELWEAQRLIEKHWRSDLAPEEARIRGFTRDALDFISSSGQRHRFRDYRQHEPSSQPHGSSGSEGDLRQAEDFFRNLLAAPPSHEERKLLQVIIDALQFIAMTGQLASLQDYIQHLEEGAPPYVVAAFDSLDEAEAWLENHPAPPDFARIIVAGEYRSVFHDRQSNIRKLPNDNALEYYLAELREAKPPIPMASFATRVDAEAWLRAQSEPARRVWVSIGGELCLAAFYPRINHRALFPLAMATGYRI
jgi:hypothetical protein